MNFQNQNNEEKKIKDESDSNTNSDSDNEFECDNDKCLVKEEKIKALYKIGGFGFCKVCMYAMAYQVAKNGL